MAPITCIVVTPEKTVLEQSVDFVALPLYDGEIGIGRDHSPLIGRLGYGELRLRVGDQLTCYYVEGGFAQVANNVVSVLTERAIPAQEVKIEEARQHLQQALGKPTHTDELLQIRDQEISQARAQMHVARRNQRRS
jgi:F-type H+-transporting ATPase subunit epsilon